MNGGTDKTRPKLLIADDDEKIIFAFQKTFGNTYDVLTASDGAAALEVLKSGRPWITFLDITMPVKGGMTVLKESLEMGIETPIIVITGYGTMNTAIEAIKLGAFDYIAKPLDIQNLRSVAAHALDLVTLRRELRDLKSVMAQPRQEGEIIGSHPIMQEIFKKIGMVAKTPNTTNILITGESGTGKELVAKAIHRSGNHGTELFQAINCTVLPEPLLESELFGYERGAFTGAEKDKQGKFEVAGSGTILLDEIGDLALDLQKKLLRVLEERVFVPTGGHRQVPVQARFIAATNQDLNSLRKKGDFRDDLFYRLNVFPIHLPTLRERVEDIPHLAEFFMHRHSHALNKRVKAISDEAFKILMAYDYPGNVRELQNIIITSVTQEQGDVITLRSLPRYLFQSEGQIHYRIPLSSLNWRDARAHMLHSFEEQFVRHLLKLEGGNVTRAAAKAGIERQSFQRLMRRYQIKSGDFR